MEWVQEPPASSGNLWYPEGMMVKSGHETVDANPQTLIFLSWVAIGKAMGRPGFPAL